MSLMCDALMLPLPACRWVGLTSIDFNRWTMREVLVERGFEKLVSQAPNEWHDL